MRGQFYRIECCLWLVCWRNVPMTQYQFMLSNVDKPGPQQVLHSLREAGSFFYEFKSQTYIKLFSHRKSLFRTNEWYAALPPKKLTGAHKGQVLVDRTTAEVAHSINTPFDDTPTRTALPGEMRIQMSVCVVALFSLLIHHQALFIALFF